MINSKLLRELDGLVVNQVIVQLCYGYFGDILASKGLKLIRLSTKNNAFYQSCYTLGGGPLDAHLHLLNLSELAPPTLHEELWRTRPDQSLEAKPIAKFWEMLFLGLKLQNLLTRDLLGKILESRASKSSANGLSVKPDTVHAFLSSFFF